MARAAPTKRASSPTSSRRSPWRELRANLEAGRPRVLCVGCTDIHTGLVTVRIGDSYYLDGGLRVNTPLSPALRLGADKALIIALK